MSLTVRVSVIEACKYVDQVIRAAPAVTSAASIQKNNIDVVVASKSYSNTELQKWYGELLRLNLLQFVDYTDSVSTTEIIKRCHANYSRTKDNV
jgi:glycerol-3-phosphate cytidylyltransferase-like family protein